MSLLPKSLNIITSAPQLPKKDWHSPQIPKTWGPSVFVTNVGFTVIIMNVPYK